MTTTTTKKQRFCIKLASSVTRWLHYFSILVHLEQLKLAQKNKDEIKDCIILI